MRAPGFIVIAPCLILVIYRAYLKKISPSEWREILILLTILLIFVLIGATRGSPATNSSFKLSTLTFFLDNNIFAIASSSVFGLTPLLFIGALFLLKDKLDLIKSGSVLVFVITCSIIYYLPVIKPLWGVSRYQAEIFVPIIIAGVIVILNSVHCIKYFNIYTAIPVVFLILVNLTSLANFDSREFRLFPDNPTPNEAIKSQAEYPIQDAFNFVKHHHLQSEVFYIGIYYGGFVSSLNGLSALEYIKFSSLNSRYRDGFSVNPVLINLDPDIKCVVIESDADSSAVKMLEDFGWTGKYVFTQHGSTHKMIVLTRKSLA